MITILLFKRKTVSSTLVYFQLEIIMKFFDEKILLLDETFLQIEFVVCLSPYMLDIFMMDFRMEEH
jgi:hypothetical protein